MHALDGVDWLVLMLIALGAESESDGGSWLSTAVTGVQQRSAPHSGLMA